MLFVSGVVLVVVALVLFEPWKLVLDRTVDEALPATPATAGSPVVAPAPSVPVPSVPAQPGASATPTSQPTSQPTPQPSPEPAAEPVILARGELIAHEHASSGSVLVLELADGSRVLRLQNLRTSDGPLLKVWLTDAPVIDGAAGWYVFDDGRHVDLGGLKGNIGSSNYPIPADLDLAELPSVSIWCDRFKVSFAAAALRPVAP